MTALHSLLVTTHVIIGAVALILFWIPVIAKKGSRVHVRAGQFYSTAMYIVSITAFVASVMVLVDPIGIRRPGMDLDSEDIADLAESFRAGSLFLLMLSVLVFTSVHHGLKALKERHMPGILKSPAHRALLVTLGLLGLFVGAVGIQRGAMLLMIFGGISIVASVSMYRETLPERLNRNQRLLAHLGGLLGSGIGAYTAFFAFGGARFFAELLPGQWQVVSWVIAPIVGTIAISRVSRRYQTNRDVNAESAST